MEFFILLLLVVFIFLIVVVNIVCFFIEKLYEDDLNVGLILFMLFIFIVVVIDVEYDGLFMLVICIMILYFLMSFWLSLDDNIRYLFVGFRVKLELIFLVRMLKLKLLLLFGF